MCCVGANHVNNGTIEPHVADFIKSNMKLLFKGGILFSSCCRRRGISPFVFRTLPLQETLQCTGCSSAAARAGCETVWQSVNAVNQGSAYFPSDLLSKGLFNQILSNTMISDTQELSGQNTKQSGHTETTGSRPKKQLFIRSGGYMTFLSIEITMTTPFVLWSHSL